jgi:hypothetical protein
MERINAEKNLLRADHIARTMMTQSQRMTLTTRLSGLKHIIQQARNERDVLENRITNLNEQIRQFHSEFNMKTLINSTVSHDTLSYIFTIVLDLSLVDWDPCANRKTYPESLYMSHVCKYWREIALSRPYLWTKRIPAHPQGLRAFVDRSRKLPISLGYEAASTLMWLSRQEPSLLSNLGRASTLYLGLSRDFQMLQSVATMFATTPPTLEALTLMYDYVSTPKTAILLPASMDMSRLRVLHLQSCCGLQWDHAILQNMT